MDRLTKLTLWLTALVLLSYAVWAYHDCMSDERCHVVFCGGKQAPCGISRN
jgi:hypothetical protein